ncbi:alpha/beta fold hydrolase [Labrys neptuniae]
MTAHWIEANGARLHYEYDRRDAGTIVLVHEMGGSQDSYAALAGLLGTRWSVLRYDQRGAGLSDRIAGPLAIDTPALDLAALLEKLAITGPVAVVGAAVGAAVAIRFAVRWPESVKALALLAPSTGLIPARREATLPKIERLEREAQSGTGTSANPGERLPAGDPGSRAATWRMLIGLDLQADLASLSCPVLVAAGMRDEDRPPAHVAEVAGKIAGARLITLDAGHVMAKEQPDEVADLLAAFLDEAGFR